jgi:hypothetical protein
VLPTLIGVGTVISTVGVTWSRGTGSPASPAESVNTSGGWPGLKIGIKIVCSTVSSLRDVPAVMNDVSS